MRLNTTIIEIKKQKKASTVSIFIRIVNNIVTQIKMSNFYLVWNGIILLRINCRLILNFFKKINKLYFNFNLRYFCFSVTVTT